MIDLNMLAMSDRKQERYQRYINSNQKTQKQTYQQKERQAN